MLVAASKVVAKVTISAMASLETPEPGGIAWSRNRSLQES